MFYALKANPDPRVARRLASLGCGFEIASATELGLLAEIGVEPERVISSNPIKAPAFVAAAHEYGVRHFGFDSDVEIDKLARCAPGCEVSVRLVVPNEGSDWPLDKKFGAAPAEAAGLMRRAALRGLIPAGVTFHVGSQCRRPESWAAALDIAGGVLAELARDGIEPRVVNVGGGMPVAYASGPAPSANDVASVVKASAARLPWPVEIWLEPGRGLVGEAGTLVTEVIGVAEREGRRWVYLDVGVFHGLAEAMGGIAYRFETNPGGAPAACTIAGPSCDSVDVITTDGLLPEVTVGDRIVIPCGGGLHHGLRLGVQRLSGAGDDCGGGPVTVPGSWFEEQDPFSPVRYRYPIEEVLHRRTTPLSAHRGAAQLLLRAHARTRWGGSAYRA